MYEPLAILAAFAMVYSAVAARVERSWISGPIVATAFGLVIGPLGVGLISNESHPELLKSLAELTLALVLFTDAAETNLGVLRRARRLPLRLLGIGLPLTIALGFGAGLLLFPAMSVVEVALLATLLAPTDAALGKPVVTSEAVPEPIREGLKVESGLNDGICVPVLFLFLALAAGRGGEEAPWHLALRLFAEEVGIGLAVGLVVSAAGAWLLGVSKRRGWESPTWITITVTALAFTCFGTAQSLGGSGFVATFAGGLLFAVLLRPHHGPLLDAAEGVGDTFALLTWALFGAAVMGRAATAQVSWSVAAYALLSLTVIRMAPVFVSLAGLGMDTEDRLFVGWFGPRGLASIVFAVIVTSHDVGHADTIVLVAGTTIVLSIIAHGVTATPWARRYGARAAKRR